MPDTYKFAYLGGVGEIIEKKSRFIATVEPVHSEEEALAFIEKIRKQYWDATHNCTAFTIGERHQLTRCSDDGEPAGTAGRPMLEVLLGEDVHDVAIVVTRYFGGTLLGTGGLVRAYSKSVQEGLRNAAILEKCKAIRLEIRTDYNGIGKIQYLLGQNHITILNSEYTDTVFLEALVPTDLVGTIIAAITEGTSGQAKMTEGDICWFAVLDGEVLLFDE